MDEAFSEDIGGPVRLAGRMPMGWPYAHFFAAEAFDPELSEALLRWLEESTFWRLRTPSVQMYYEFEVAGKRLPEAVAFLTDAEFLHQR